MILEITTPKDSEETWTIPIDVSDRLDTTESVVFIEGFAKISQKFETRQTIELGQSDEIVVQIIKFDDDDKEVRITDLIGDSVQFQFQSQDTPTDNTVWDASQLTIDPGGQSFQVVITGGVPGNQYDLNLNVVTDSDPTLPNSHKVILRWSVT